MKKLSVSFAVLLAATFLNFSTSNALGHGHLYIGATGTNPGDALTFDNAADFGTNSGFVFTLNHTDEGTYAGYYAGNLTFAVLAATAENGSSSPFHPALGSMIYAQLVSVEGPANGEFAFWDSGAAEPTIRLASGSTGTHLWKLSQNDGSPGTDPFGHIHGRQFTATRPGIYMVTFRAFDLSTNGIDGAPIHTPSEPVQIYFQAGVNVQSVVPESEGVRVRFGAPLGNNWQVEATDDLSSPANWIDVGDPIAGDDVFAEVLDSNPSSTNRFYRIKSVP